MVFCVMLHVFLCMFDLIFHVLGSAMCFQKNGSFTTQMFADVITHLHVYGTPGKKLLILDGHSSHGLEL